MRIYWALKVKEEAKKQFELGFIVIIEYPVWIANIVPVPKTDRRIRVCVNFLDLNKANSKDDFPLLEFEGNTCDPPFQWDDQCPIAFDKIKSYLQNPPICSLLIPTNLYSYTCLYLKMPWATC